MSRQERFQWVFRLLAIAALTLALSAPAGAASQTGVHHDDPGKITLTMHRIHGHLWRLKFDPHLNSLTGAVNIYGVRYGRTPDKTRRLKGVDSLGQGGKARLKGSYFFDARGVSHGYIIDRCWDVNVVKKSAKVKEIYCPKPVPRS